MYKTASAFISLFFVAIFSLAQRPLPEDYKVYDALIRTEVNHKTKSVTIIKNLEKETSSEFFIDAISSGNKQELNGYIMLIKKPDDIKVDTERNQW